MQDRKSEELGSCIGEREREKVEPHTDTHIHTPTHSHTAIEMHCCKVFFFIYLQIKNDIYRYIYICIYRNYILYCI